MNILLKVFTPIILLFICSSGVAENKSNHNGYYEIHKSAGEFLLSGVDGSKHHGYIKGEPPILYEISLVGVADGLTVQACPNSHCINIKPGSSNIYIPADGEFVVNVVGTTIRDDGKATSYAYVGLCKIKKPGELSDGSEKFCTFSGDYSLKIDLGKM